MRDSNVPRAKNRKGQPFATVRRAVEAHESLTKEAKCGVREGPYVLPPEGIDALHERKGPRSDKASIQ